MRGSRRSRAAFAVACVALAQLIGCSSCVKDEPPPPPSPSINDRPVKPLMKGIDQKLTQQFNTIDSGGGAVDASGD